MFYTAVWCNTNETDLKKNIPFELLAQSIKRYGSTTKFKVVFLEGIEKISNEYFTLLENSGFTIIDYCEQFLKIVEQYPSLHKYYSNYERNCFLRWIAFQNIHEKELGNNSQFWHIDSDVILHASLDELCHDTAGKTFMLQGCPVFVSVSNFEWFRTYEKELKELNDDIIGYSNKAFQKRDEYRLFDLSLVNESLYRNPIGSDQDMLQYLVSSRKIYQDNNQLVFNSKFYFIQNALSIRMWHGAQVKQSSYFESGDNLEINVAEKKLAFVHYQSTFSNYINIYLFLKGIYIPVNLIKLIIRYQITGSKVKLTFVFKIVSKGLTVFKKPNRIEVIKKLVSQKRTGSESQIVDVLNLLIDLE